MRGTHRWAHPAGRLCQPCLSEETRGAENAGRFGKARLCRTREFFRLIQLGVCHRQDHTDDPRALSSRREPGEAAVAAAVAGAGIARVLSYLIKDLLKSRSLVTLLDACVSRHRFLSALSTLASAKFR